MLPHRQHLVDRALAELAAGTARPCPCGAHLGHRLIEVSWIALQIGEICLDCGAVDFEWIAGQRCTSRLTPAAT